MTNTENEVTSRLALYNRVSKIAHRAIGPIVSDFRAAVNTDPAFAARMLVYIAKTSRNRDVVDAAIVTLLTADPELPGLREAGRVLVLGNAVYANTNVPVNGVEPFRILRVLKYMAFPVAVTFNGEEVERFATEKQAKAALERIAGRLTVRANRGQKDYKKWTIKVTPEQLKVTRDAGHVQARRQAEGVLNDWIKALSNEPAWFDSVAILNRANLNDVITHYHAKLDERANGILFARDYPEDSVFSVIRRIVQSDNAQAKCELAIGAKLPLQVATSILGELNADGAPAQNRTMYGVTIVALMTPAQATNMAQWFEQSGLMEIPEVKKVYLEKVAKDTKRGIAAREGRESAKAQTQEVKDAQAKATVKAIAKAAKIENDILLCVDKSQSMTSALVRAVEVGAHIAPYCAGNLKVVVFNDTAAEIKIKPGERSDINAWRRAFALERATGGTSMMMALKVGLADGYRPAEIVFITDGEEVSNQRVASSWRFEADYRPRFTILKVGNYNTAFEKALKGLGLDVTVLDDPIGKEGLDTVAESLMGKRGLSTIERIMETELPARVTV